MKTFTLKAAQIEKAWHVIDAEDMPLGRIASRAAVLLRGKHKPTFSPHLDMGDFVVVVNAEKVKLSSNEEDKKYHRHTGFPGGLRTRTFREMRDRQPTKIIEIAVKGMLPHNRLGASLLRHLKVYAGPTHPHEAQLNAGTGARAQKRADDLAKTIVVEKPARRTAPRAEAPAVEAPEVEQPVAEMPGAEEAVAKSGSSVTLAEPKRAARKPAAPKAKAATAEKAPTKPRAPRKSTKSETPAKEGITE